MALIDITERKKVKVQFCIPSNPVALYWLNKLGGWDMWVFGKTQIKSVQTIEGEEFNKNITDLAIANTKEQLLTKEDTDTITLGANNIDTEDVTFIRGMFSSLKVMMLVSQAPHTPPIFRSVNIEDGTFVLIDTFQQKQNLEFIINTGINYNQEL